MLSIHAALVDTSLLQKFEENPLALRILVTVVGLRFTDIFREVNPRLGLFHRRWLSVSLIFTALFQFH